MKVAGTIEAIKKRTMEFREKYETIRYSVTEALIAQIEEYKTSVDNTERYGVHVSMN
jgi:predicted transcriptional regulator